MLLLRRRKKEKERVFYLKTNKYITIPCKKMNKARMHLRRSHDGVILYIFKSNTLFINNNDFMQHNDRHPCFGLVKGHLPSGQNGNKIVKD